MHEIKPTAEDPSNVTGSLKMGPVSKLIQKMNYKTFEKNKYLFFRYTPTKQKIKRYIKKNKTKDNPFNVLKNISFK